MIKTPDILFWFRLKFRAKSKMSCGFSGPCYPLSCARREFGNFVDIVQSAKQNDTQRHGVGVLAVQGCMKYLNTTIGV